MPEPNRHRRRPARLWATGLLAALLSILVGSPSTGIVLHSITIDGNVSDWGDVLTDPENVVADAGSFSDPVDPDVPGTADRDLRGVAFTYDATNLYLFFRRTLSGNSAFEFLAYIDLGHDKRLQATDVVVRLSYNGAAFSGSSVRRYVPVDAVNGDPITGDGQDEPGSLGAVVPGAPASANSPDGIEFEASIPWSVLGVPAGTCLWIHPAIARGVNLPSQVEDNTDPLDTQDVNPTLELDQDGSSASPGQVDYAHRACNEGTCSDVLDLTVRSGDNWRIEIWSDPNGDGNPADGSLLGIDGNGDGDYSDARDGDSLSPGADSNGNGLVDTGSLGADACFDYVVRVFVPAGVAAGTVDIESVRARSATRPRDLVRNTDRTHVGPITLFADEDVSAFPGDLAWIPHVLCNEQAVADTMDLAVSSALGWTVATWSDPNGDGDPADGAPITAIGPLNPGQCATLLVRAAVPPGAAAGALDEITVSALSRGSPGVSATAVDTVLVAPERFSVVPDHDRDAGPGNVLFLPHVLTNHQGVPDSFQLTATSADGTYTVRLLSDPDGDGEPDDSAPIPNGSIVGPVGRNGGELHFILRVDVPAGALIGSSNTVTITARSQLDTTRTDVATDIIRIRRILTYSDPLFARPSKTFFTGCSQVYVQAHGLQTNREYRFLWIDPASATQRTSPAYSPDARGRADDAYGLPCGPPPGTWSVRLQIRSGSAWNDVAGATATFTTLDPAADGGDITRLEVDQPIYDRDGDDVSVEATFDNDTDADYIDTFGDYVIFQDLDANGEPTAGEPYILADGTRSTWDPGEFTHRTEPIDILSADTYEDYWRVPAAQFDTEGTWCTHLRWVQRCNSGSCSEIAIDTEVTCFLVSCLPAPLVEAGAPKQACDGDTVALSDAASDGDTHSWSDGGAGGTFSPSATVLNPTWLAPGPGSYTLTLLSTFTATSCSSRDTVNVTIHPNPIASAGADLQTCAGDGIALSGASSDGDTHSWSDGGAGGSFTPSSSVLNPTYVPPDPSPASITLTLTTSFAATGCDTVDALVLTVHPNPVASAGSDLMTCAGDGIALSWATSDADTHSWSDGGAGGSFTPSSSVLNPTYVPPDPSPASLTLTLTSSFAATGCDTVDALALTVHPNPIASAGADLQTCAGDGIALGGATSDGDTHSWSDGGAGGSFTPSASVLNPTYVPPDPSPASITLTLTSSFAATGCDTVDALLLTVHPNPIASAGSDLTTCASDGIALSGATSDGDTHSWSDGGAGGSFTPSASVLNPTYVPPDPSPASITLTLITSFAATGCDTVDALALTVHPNPVASAGADLETCAGDGVALSAATSDGDTHSWSDGGAGGSFTPSSSVLNPTYVPPDPSPASITLTLTTSFAATGCDTVDALVLTVHPNPIASAGSDLTTCAGDGIALSGATSDADTHSWSDGGAGGSFAPSSSVLNPTYVPPDPSPAILTLTLTSSFAATGCDTVDALALTVHPNPIASAGADLESCAGDGIALSGATSDADTHSWSDGGAGGSFAPSSSVLNPTYVPPDPSPASITLTLITSFAATGCDTVDALALTVHPNPIASAGSDLTTCAGDGIALSGATSDGDTHSWSDGGAGGSFSPSSSVLNPTYVPPDPSPASLTLTLTTSFAATGCDTVDALALTVHPNPIASAGSDLTTCAGDGIALSGATSDGDAHSWSDGGAGGSFTPSSSVLNPTYVPPDPSPASLTLTLITSFAATGCDTVDALLLTVHPNPVVSAGADKATCAGSAVSLSDADGGAADAFAWSDGGAGGTFSPSASVENPTYSNPTPGTRILTFTATIGATGCASSDSVQVTVNPRPSADAGAPQEGCAGADVALSDATSDADTFAWSDGGAGGTFSPSAGVLRPSYRNSSVGTHVLTLTATHSATGCSSSDTVAVTIRPLPVAAFAPPPGSPCEDAPACFDNTSSGATSYHWDFGDGSGVTSTEFEPCHVFSQPGTYGVTLTATNACGSDVETRNVTIAPKPVADFSFSTQGNRFCRAKDVSFTDLSTNAPTSWQWDFGDGATSTARNPVHQYATDGVFIVSLVACNGCGCSAPRYRPVEIAASCNTNCEANSNQIECELAPATITGNTCTDRDNFNTTSYACAPGIIYGGENKTYDLNFAADSNFIIRLIETVPEPNGYELDLIVSDRCNPPRCVAWGDDEVTYDDRTAVNDDFFLIVDGRDGSCGPYRLEIECLDDADTAACAPPDFDGILSATDENSCLISGIVLEWLPAANWGLGPDGLPCDSGSYEIWRAPASDPGNERRIGTAYPPATTFLDITAVPGTEYVYRVHAINDCCGEVALTDATATATDEFGDDPVLADAGPDKRLTCASPTVMLQGSASGGTGSGFDWLWTPSAGLSDATVSNPIASLPGTYTLTVTDRGNGCVDTDIVTVTQAPSPVASAGPDKVLTCAVTIVALEGSASGGDDSGGRSYAWTPAGPLSDPSSPTPSTSTAGSYELTVTDLATGCTSTDTVLVTANDEPPVASAGPDRVITCDEPSVVLAGSASGGDDSMGRTYAWSPAAGLDDPTAQQPVASTEGTWSLVVTDVATGCSSVADTVTVTRNDAPPVASAGPDRVLTCAQPTASLDGSASGGDGSAGYAFAWSPPENVADPSAEDTTTNVAGTYVLTVTDLATGCTDTDTVIVSPDPNAPVANAGPDKDITCRVDSVVLEGSASGGDDSLGYEYRWEPAADVSDPDVAQPTTSIPGTYTLTVITPADGCRVQDVVVVHDEREPPAAEAGPPSTLTCTVTSVTLFGSASGNDGRAGFTYAWEPAGLVSDPAAAQPTTGEPGTYTLTVTDAYTGCSSSDSVVVSEDVVPPLANAGPDKVRDCNASTVLLEGSASGGNGSAGYAFAWEPAGLVSDPGIAQPTTSAPGTYTLTVTDLANGCTDTDTVEVVDNAVPPVADAGPDRVLTCAATSVVLAGSASGGDGSLGYSYAWEPAGSVSDPGVPQPTTSAPGTYTLTVTDLANGCTDTDTVIVTEDVAAPVASAGPDKELTCTVTTVTLDGSASGGNGSLGYSYRWAPPGSVSDPDIARPTTSVPGSYTLTVTDLANGCTDTDVVVVAYSADVPAASAGPDKTLTCAVTVVQLEGSATGGDDSAGRTWSWTPAGPLSDPGSPTPTTSTEGTYELTVTDLATGCSSTDTVTVSRNDTPPVGSAGPDGLITCNDPTVTLQGSATGGDGSAGRTWAWSPAAGLDDPSAAQPVASTAGTWTLVVTDVATGCSSAADSVTVTRNDAPPVAGAGPDRVLTCAAPTVTLDGSASGGDGSAGYAFSWSPPENVSDPAAEDPTTSIAGTYALTITDLATGCTDTDEVVVSPDPGAPVANAGPDQDITCLAPSVTLEGSASGGDDSLGYRYRWEPASDVSDPDIARPTTSVPGTYTLVVTTPANGCVSQDVVVIHDEREAPVAEAGPPRVLSCAVSVVTLLGSASGNDGRLGFTYAWTPAGLVSDPSIARPTTGTAGTYTLTVTDAYTGCSSSDTVTVTQDVAAPVANAGPDKVRDCNDPAVILEGSASGGNGGAGYGFSWEPAGLVSDPGIAQPSASAPGTYTLTVTDLVNGCTDTDTVVVSLGGNVPIASAGADKALDCRVSTVQLDGSASGGDGSLGYSYSWSPAAGLSDPAIARPTTSQPGTWTLTVTDIATGCTASDVVSVIDDRAPPVASAGPDLVITCANPAPIQLQGSASGGNGSLGYDFFWSPPAGLSDRTSPTPTTTQARTYTLEVTDRATGCTATDTVTVTRDERAPTASAGADARLTCVNAAVTLSGSASGGNGSAGYSYSWAPAAGLSDPAIATPTASAPGTYTLTVTDLANGCTDTDAVTVTDDRVPPVASAGADKQLACGVTVVTLDGSASGGNGSAGYSYSWAPAAGLSDPAIATPTTSAAGTWTLTVTDLANGCTSSDSVTVTQGAGAPVADAGADQVATCAAPAQLLGSASGGDDSAGRTFRWEPAADVSDPDIANPTTFVPGSYTLTVTDVATGCSATDSVVVSAGVVPRPPDPSALDLRPASPPLRVRFADPLVRTQLAIDWEDVAAFENRLYQGLIASVGPPGSGAFDHGAAACGLLAPSVTLPLPQGNVYFLAVAANCAGGESSYGRGSDGTERPDAATASGNACP